MSTATFLTQLCTNLLGRAPDQSGLAFWTEVIDAGRADAAAVTQQFIDSPEFANVVQPLARLYYAAFGRIPDQGGLLFWTKCAQGGQAYEEIVQHFAASGEFAAKYSALDNGAFLDALSQTALGHAMDGTSKTAWLARLTAHTATRADVLQSVVSSTEMATAKADAVKVIAQFYGTIGTVPSTMELNAAIAAHDPLGLITKLYASDAYTGAAVPNLNAHGAITEALGKGATVFIDTNANGKLDAGEVSATADNAGHYSFDHAVFNGTVTVLGVNGSVAYTAPAGATVINALSTVVQQVAAAQHIDMARAEQVVRSALGIGSGLDLLSTDPTVVAANPTLDATVRDAAAKMQAASAQLATVLGQTSAALKGLGLAADTVSANAAALRSIATFIAAPSRQGAVDLADSGAVQTVLKGAAALLSASPAQLAALSVAAPELASVIVNINSAIAHATGSSASALVSQIGLIESNAGAALSKLAAGDIATALDLTASTALLKMQATMSGGGNGISNSGPPVKVSAGAFTDEISLGFSEDVAAGSGKIVITDGDSQTKYNTTTGKLETRVVGATHTEIVDINDSRVHFTGTTLTVTGLTLEAGKQYSVMMERGVVRDLSGDSFAGLTDANQLRLTPTASAAPHTSFASFTAAGAMKAGVVVYVYVSFDDNVTVPSGATPTLELSGGRVATYDSGSGTGLLRFKYTVQASDNLAKLELVDPTGLAGQIQSGAGAVLDAAHINFDHITGNGYGDISFDNIAPTYSLTMDRTTFDATHKTAQVTLQFSEKTYGVSLADFTAQNGTLSGLASTDNITYTATFTVNDGVADTTNVITYTPSTAHDPATNAATGSQNAGNYTIDTQFSAFVDSLSGFSDTGIDTGDYITNAGAQTIGGTYQGTLGGTDVIEVAINGHTGNASVNTTNHTWTYSYGPLDAGANNVSVYVKDSAGHTGAPQTQTLTYDNVAPTPTVASTIASNQPVTLTFDEAVYKNGDGNIQIVSDADTSILVSLADVVFSGDHKTLTIMGADTLRDNHTYSIHLPSQLTDVAGNAYSGTDPAFRIPADGAPHATSAYIDATGTLYGPGATIKIKVAFDEAVTVTGSPTIQLETGTVDRNAVYDAAGSTSTTLAFLYTVQVGDSTTDLDMISTSILGDIKDGDNNFLTASHILFDHLGDGAYGAVTIDGVAPVVGSTNIDPGDHNVYGPQLELGFSEQFGFGSGSIQLWRMESGVPVLAGTYSSTSGNWTAQENTLKLNLPTGALSLPVPGDYYVTTVGSPIHDLAGNVFGGYSTAADLPFHVPATS